MRRSLFLLFTLLILSTSASFAQNITVHWNNWGDFIFTKNSQDVVTSGVTRYTYYNTTDDMYIRYNGTLGRWEITDGSGGVYNYNTTATFPKPPGNGSGAWVDMLQGGGAVSLSGDVSSGAAVVPSVSTTAVGTITTTTAVLGGNVTADGGASVTERGIVWGTANNPTTANNKVSNGSGTGTFSATVSSLPTGTRIYYRAYAINSAGTSYGTTSDFITIPATPATPTATAVTASSFTLNWSLVTGAALYRLDVSTSNTFSSFVTGFNNQPYGQNITSANVTGLNAGTTYYFRIRAINDNGGTSASSTTGSQATGSLNTTPLAAGDLAIVGYNYDKTPQELAIVTLATIPANTKIYISDYGWDGSLSTPAFTSSSIASTAEGAITWTTNTSVPAGTLLTVKITTGSVTGDLSTYGTVSMTGWTASAAAVPMAGVGDNFFIYQGTSSSEPTNFIYGWSNTSTATFNSQPIGAGDFLSSIHGALGGNILLTYLPSGLTKGTTAVALTAQIANHYHGDNSRFPDPAQGTYAAATTGTKSELLAKIGNNNYWLTNETTAYDLAPGGAVYTANPSFTVRTLANAAPTDIAMSATSINENVSAGSTVGTLSTTDANTDDTFTYTLVSGSGDTDNASFEISGSTLTITTSPDYEVKSSYSIRIRSTDLLGASYDKVFTININNLPDPPTRLSVHYWNFNTGSSTTTDAAWSSPIASNSSLTTPAGSLSWTNITRTEDFSGTSTDYTGFTSTAGNAFAIVNLENNARQFTLNVPTTGYQDIIFSYAAIKTSTGFNVGISYSTDGTNFVQHSTQTLTTTFALYNLNFTSLSEANNNPNFKIRFTLQDGGSSTGNSRFDNIRLTGFPSVSPTDIALSASSINENVAANSTVGTLSSTDPGTSDTFTYTLVPGTGSTDNASFNISGSSLRITNSPDYETKSSYSVRIRTTDQDGNYYEKTFTITINDVLEIPGYVVINTNDSGAGSLREAINQANLSAGAGYNITFNIPGTAPFLISPATQLPNITKKVTIDGTTQPNYAGAPLIQIDGSSLSNKPGIYFSTGGNTIKGLSLTKFAPAIFSSSDNLEVLACYVGLKPDGTTIAANSTGIDLGGGTGHIIGGTTSGSGNLISGNTTGITVRNASAVKIQGNMIGLDASGTQAKGNTIGISSSGTGQVLIGTDADGVNDINERNIISGNSGYGVYCGGSKATTIAGNYIGANAAGTTSFTSQYGIHINVSGANTIVGGNTSAAANLIVGATIGIIVDGNTNTVKNNVIGKLGLANSSGIEIALSTGGAANNNIVLNEISYNSAGIVIRNAATTGNMLSQNSVHHNTGLGIDIGNNGVTSNDTNDADTGPNNLINFPVITNVSEAAGSTTITGTIDMVPAVATYTIELFANSKTYTPAYGQGETYIGNVTVTTDAAGHGTFTKTVTGSFTNVSATATDGSNNTSEFSATFTPNLAPTDIALSASSINENVAANSTVGTLSTTDADAGNTFTYTLVTGTGDTDNASFNISGNSLRITASPDFETKSSYSVRIKTTDQGGLTFEKAFAITINNLNEAPTDVTLSASSINENVAGNSTVGTLTTTDVDASNTFTYSLVTGTGDTDNSAFNINGNSLRITASPDFETKSSYSVRIRTTDQGGLTFEKVFTITISDVNEGANAYTGAQARMEVVGGNPNFKPLTNIDGAVEFNISGTLFRIDIDPVTFQLKLIIAGSTGASLNQNQFDIIFSGVNFGALTSVSKNNTASTSPASSNFTAAKLNDNTVRFTVVASGVKNTGNNGEVVWDIPASVAVANSAPTNIALSASSINENVAANATVGTLTSTDPDAGNTFTYTLVTGTGDTDNAAFNISGNSLRISASPDYETKSSYSVRIKTTDQGGLTFEKVFTVTINNVNDAPTDITLSATSINEAVPTGSTVGTFSSTDQDAANTFTYSLVSGTGDTDNAAFTMVTNSLRINARPDYEAKNSYSIRVRSTDQGGLTFEKVFTITINDLPEDNTAPTITSVVVPSAGSYTTGQKLTFTVNFSENIAINPSEEPAYIPIVIGSTTRRAYNISGDGTNALVFEYTVVAGDVDANGITYNNIELDGNIFSDSWGNDANLAYNSAGSTAQVLVNPPANTAPTDVALSANTINENVAANSVIGTLSTTDADASNTFTYTLVSGAGSTHNSSFNINGNELRISNSPDFELQNSFNVRIRTTDQGGLFYEEAFVVSIANVNESPTDIFLTSTSIAENSSANSTVATLSPGDPDPAGSHTYALVSGTGDTDNASFSLTGTSLKINGVPDYETKSSYSIRLKITDQDGLTFEKNVTINVTDVAELATVSTSAVTTFTASTATLTGNVSADNGGAVTEKGIVYGTSLNPTVVTGTKLTDGSGTGAISANASGLQSSTLYHVRAYATNSAGTSYGSDQTFTTLTPNFAPTNIALSASSVNENVAANATIGMLSTTDPDAGNTFTYTLVAGTGDTDNASFNISGSSLRISASPDFETKNSYSVRIRTTDQGGLTFEKAFTVSINNVNEAPTDIALSATSINENVAANSTVGTLSSTDADASNTFTYTLVSGTGSTDNAAFNISGNSLRISASPDFETKNSYSIRVRSTDQGSLNFEKVFTITVNNVNETPSDVALSATSINENVSANSTVGLLSTTDVDAGDTFTYTLVSGAGSTNNDAFSITSNSLKISASPDFEYQNSFSIRVRSTDQGGLFSEKVFNITIINVNEAPTDIFLSATSINENVAANSTVATLSPGDPDPAGSHSYSLVTGAGDTDNAAFNINGTSLRFTGVPDYETKNIYSIRIRNTDQDGLTFEKSITININNINEAPTDIALSSTSINENQAANSTVGTLSTTDGDPSNTFTYTLVAGTGSTDNAAFNISGDNLVILSSPDFEAKNSYSVRVRTTDQGGLTTEKAFTITINNVNEVPSDIALSANSVNENVAANSTIGTLSSTDVDASDTFTYTLVSGTGSTDNAAFSISGSNLRISASPDFETKNSYSVRIRTTDQGGLTFEKAFTVSINNVNEAPTDIALSATSVNENVAANSTVGTLSSTDADASNTFTYTLVSGTGSTDNAAFNISGNSLRISASPDFETKNSYSIRVRSTDQGSLNLEKVFTITINNVNETPTDIALSATSVNENVAANSTVGTLSTTDIDASNTFTYTLVSGTGSTDNAAFNISGNSLKISASPDFETKNSYAVRVRTTDQDGLSYEKVFTISVNNLNEAPSDIALSATSVNENVAANTTVGTLSSTDVDASNTFTYSLVAGAGSADNAAFNISGNNLRISASPDFETKNSYSVRIRTTDQGGLTYEKVFVITVDNVNEAPSDLVLSATSINENVSANSTVGTLTTTDVDATNTFTYTLVSGTGSTDNAAFNISGNNFRITASPDFESKNSYSVRLRTTDQDGLTFEKVFAITINNVNEAPSDIALSATSINENVAANTTVGTLSSTDVDASNTFTYTLVAGTGSTDNAAFNISGTSLRIVASPDYETKNSYSIRLRSTDQGGLTYEKAFTITVDDVTELVFTTTNLPAATVGTTYQEQINVTVGASPYTFALVSGTMPAGLTLSTDGKISGAPTAGGTFNITVKATDNNGVTATKAYTLNVNAPTIMLTASLPNALVGAAYSQTITTTGGTAPYTYALTQGSLPPGLSLSTTGVINGTATTGGSFNFTVSSTDASTGTGPYSNNKAYTLIVDPAVQTITFNANGTATYGDADFDPAASSTNTSNPIVYSTSDAAIATIVGNKVHIVKAGVVTIYADQAANASYTAAAQKQQILTINPKSLTVSLTGNVRRAYNATNTATLTSGHFVLAGKVGADNVSIAIPATATYNDKNAGIGKTVTATALTLEGADRGNYQLANTTVSANIGLISAKPITLTLNSTSEISKVYDRNSSATLAAGNYTLVDVENGDDLAVTGTATYDSPLVGAAKTITANTFVLSGVDKDNYRLTTTTATITGAITAKPLTLALNANPSITKVYDGNTLATLASGNYSLTGVQVGDAVTVSGVAAFNDKIVGSGKTVTASAFVLGGADKDNYSLTTTSATTTGAITAKPISLTLNATPAITKVYDGNTNASLAGANYSLAGLVGADVVSVSGTGTYNSAAANANKVVTVNAFILGGTDKDNYSLTTTLATTTGSITSKPLTLALNATPAITKVYDGTTLATLAAGNYSLTGVQAGDAVSVTGSATFNDKSVASNKTITANAFVLGGADKDNYTLTTTSATTTGAITAKPITLTLNATPVVTKVYDGNTNASLAAGNYSLTGLVGGDAVSVSGTATYNNASANIGKAVTANAFVLTGIDKDNYALTTTTASTTGTITKANLTITAQDKTRVQNTPDPIFTASFAGFVNGETNAVLTTQPSFSTTATATSLPGTYPIVATGAAALNYNISYVNGTLTVTPGAPTSITLTQTSLFENRPAGTLAGTLTSTSDDPNASFTYALVAGNGDTDNNLFTITGQQLNTASALNFEQKSSYSIRVRSTTQYGLTLDRVITVTLSDVNEAPSFNTIANQTICAIGDRRSLVVAGISAGPETAQTTTFTVSSNNAALFSELTIANNGVLNYRTAEGKSGVATITVTIKDNGGTANGGVDTYSQTFTLTVNPLPDLAITTDGGKVELAKGETLVLKAIGGTTYNWTQAPGIIGNRNSAELTIRPEATTTYTVEAISAAGCSSTKSITITVKEDLIVVKGTNILSPNGDGKNDRFVIKNIDMYPNNTVKIYDRAGRLLFSQVNYTDQFDGTFQGSPLAEDTYYYIVDFGPTKTKLKGFITIVRD